MNLLNKPRSLLLALALVVGCAPLLRAQARTDLSGTWQAETPDGPQTVVVRPDSSASFGEDMIRWRIVADTVFLALGGEWIGYNYTLRGRILTLSGGDLEEPVELERIGPPTPRPEGVPVPPDPAAPGPPSVSDSP